jgi:2-polyprenyl-6-methoxyphenol hydroxylase-like FAD-dependent oxidoreductase
MFSSNEAQKLIYSMRNLRGGGIGGLACAVALAKVPGIEVHIYEAANAFTNIGAGIGTWSRGWEVLKKLGLGQELGPLADPVAAKEGRSESEKSDPLFNAITTH